MYAERDKRKVRGIINKDKDTDNVIISHSCANPKTFKATNTVIIKATCMA